MQDELLVTKESGEKEPFDPDKVEKAVRRVGLSQRDADAVLKRLRPRLFSGIPTKKIYAILSDLIDERRPEASHRFNLKRALLGLGPAGYEFEDFMGELLRLQGYKCELRQLLRGKCVGHEIDVVASRNGKVWMCECKFHNAPGVKCRIQDALYSYARFLDLREGAKLGACRDFSNLWLISNTKFSDDVKQYANCIGFPLLGWRYPFGNGLETMIEKEKCFPVTVIPMPQAALRRLLDRKIVTVFDIPQSAAKLESLAGLQPAVAREIVERAEYAR